MTHVTFLDKQQQLCFKWSWKRESLKYAHMQWVTSDCVQAALFYKVQKIVKLCHKTNADLKSVTFKFI